MKKSVLLLTALLALPLMTTPVWAKKKAEAAPVSEKAAKDADKAAKKQAKAEEKAAKKQAKAEEKAAKDQAKAAEKQAKAEEKAAKDAKKKEAAAEKTKAKKETPVSDYDGQKWEYKAVKLSPPKNDKWMNRWDALGSDGWQLAGQVENYYIFKRPVEGSGKHQQAASEAQSF